MPEAIRTTSPRGGYEAFQIASHAGLGTPHRDDAYRAIADGVRALSLHDHALFPNVNRVFGTNLNELSPTDMRRRVASMLPLLGDQEDATPAKDVDPDPDWDYGAYALYVRRAVGDSSPVATTGAARAKFSPSPDARNTIQKLRVRVFGGAPAERAELLVLGAILNVTVHVYSHERDAWETPAGAAADDEAYSVFLLRLRNGAVATMLPRVLFSRTPSPRKIFDRCEWKTGKSFGVWADRVEFVRMLRAVESRIRDLPEPLFGLYRDGTFGDVTQDGSFVCWQDTLVAELSTTNAIPRRDLFNYVRWRHAAIMARQTNEEMDDSVPRDAAARVV
tara:strand:+ start:12807 stop:13808 length:1002 start_codon:yes stop_codon:yes gene_type:complete